MVSISAITIIFFSSFRRSVNIWCPRRANLFRFESNLFCSYEGK